MTLDIGIVGAGNRGRRHAVELANCDGTNIAAVADIDEGAGTTLADDHDAAWYDDYHVMFADVDLDSVSVCVHNNLHRPVTVAAAEAGANVFCEKPMAGTFADAHAMADAAAENDVHLGVQNEMLFRDETRAAKNLIDAGKLGTVIHGEGVYSRRRGRPFVDGYGTPAFVSRDSAGGGPVLDIGTYVIGRMLYLLGNASVSRVTGATYTHTDDAYIPTLTGDHTDRYHDRIETGGYDVEDAGIGFAHLEDGTTLTVRTAWHMFAPDRSDFVVGSQGGVSFDPFEFKTTIEDYEADVSLDLAGFERRHALLESETGYDIGDTNDQFQHWVDTIDGSADDPIPTGDIALNSMLVMEGIYLANDAGSELSADDIQTRSGTI